jgi:hypothetical protein
MAELGAWQPTAHDQFGLAAIPRGAAATLTEITPEW